MDLYPLDLVLTTSLAWATIFLGALPTSLLRKNVFARLVGFAGVAWLFVATTVPLAIVHYYIAFALLCFYAWRQLRLDCALRGKVWLMVAAGLGISLGVVLILALRLGVENGDAFEGERLLYLVLNYITGAMIGLAIALYFFTRLQATHADISPVTIQKSAGLLLALALLRGLIPVLALLTPDVRPAARPPLYAILESFLGPLLTNWLAIAIVTISILVLPTLAWLGRRLSTSPAPSRSGTAFLAVAALGIATQIFFCFS